MDWSTNFMYRDAANDEKVPEVAVDGGHVTALLISVVSVTVPDIMTLSFAAVSGAAAATSTPDSLDSSELLLLLLSPASPDDSSLLPPLGSSMASCDGGALTDK